MGTKRYHSRVYFEEGAVSQIKNLIRNLRGVEPTNHFAERQMDFRYGFPPVPTKEDLLHGFIFEYYRDESGRISKFCVRCSHLSRKHDAIYIVSRLGRIITGWLNNKGDQHFTQDMRAYERSS